MKKILVTQRLVASEIPGETREALDIRWASFLQRAGFLPVPLALRADPEMYFGEPSVCGVLLTGGNDLSQFSDSPLSIMRDAFEKKVVALAMKKNLPVIGVCRGMQFLADYFQIPLQRVENHVRTRHPVQMKETRREVNSFHQYGFLNSGPDFETTAQSPDGVAEAMRHKTLPITAMMWHPEREEPFAEADVEFFKNFYSSR